MQNDVFYKGTLKSNNTIKSDKSNERHNSIILMDLAKNVQL